MVQETDVVVAGSGAAGLTAALAANAAGLRVEMLEKSDRVGGGTAYSYGLIWAGNNHLQRRLGIGDSSASSLAYLQRLAGGHEVEERLRALASRCPDAVEFLCRCGLGLEIVEGFGDMYAGRIAGARAGAGRLLEPAPIAASLLGEWADRVLVPEAFSCRARVAEFRRWGGIHNQRGWDDRLVADRTEKDIRCLGAGLVVGLLHQVLRRGVTPRLENGIARLLVENGRVAGVETTAGERIRAALGVVVATGGFESNLDLMAAFDWLPGYESMYPASRDGDGLVQSAEIGARLRTVQPNVRAHLGYRMPPSGSESTNRGPFRLASIIELASPHTLVVNRAGRRFANEARFAEAAAQIRYYDEALQQHPNLPAFLIFDRQYVERFTFAGNPPGAPLPDWVVSKPTIAELEQALGIDADGLQATVKRFNGFTQTGVDRDFGRGGDLWRQAGNGPASANNALGTIVEPPFCGIKLSPTYSSMTGIDCDAQGRALHQRGHAITGLYVVGNAAAPGEIGVGYQAGTSLGAAITFAWLAVCHMAARHWNKERN